VNLIGRFRTMNFSPLALELMVENGHS